MLVVLGLCLAVAGFTRGRLPLWSTLLGAAAMAGAYEATYTADPPSFVSTSATVATSILLAAGAGFLATSLLGVVVVQDREEERAGEAAPFAQPDQPAAVYEGAASSVEAPRAPRRGLPATRPFDPQPEA